MKTLSLDNYALPHIASSSAVWGDHTCIQKFNTHGKWTKTLYTILCVCVCVCVCVGRGGEGERERKNSSIPLSYETMNT